MMALNFSHRPIFTSHMSEENLVSPMKIVNGYIMEGITEKSESYVLPQVEDCFHYGRDIVNMGCSQESVSKDIIDLLPSDPFGMDISSTVTAITGWLEDLEVDYGGYKRKSIGASKEEYNLFAGLNFIWNNAMMFHSYPVDHNNAKAANFRNESSSTHSCNVESSPKNVTFCSDEDGGVPHEAFLLALSYLELRDLFVVERVCKTVRFVVRNDPLLWRNIHIDQPLNDKITDDVLLQLTNRAQGKLQCLSLVECPRITDDSLKKILETNPRLTKLCVPGCTRLSIECIMNSLKLIKSNKANPGIKQLRIGGLYGVTLEHFEELKMLLCVDSHETQQSGHKPHFYLRGNLYILCDDERAIDIEICPKCKKLRLVYDCPAEECHVHNNNIGQVCRACTLCISRCVQCGCCINDREFEETFCLELLCSDCYKQAHRCHEQERNQNNSRHHG